MKIGLGTAQFGLDYGISNPLGKTPFAEVKRILDIATKNGVHIIDTASIYGDSERVLGQCLTEHHPFYIITKTPQYNKPRLNVEDAEQLKGVFHESLGRLKQSSLYGLLIHNADDLLTQGGGLLWEAMKYLKQGGLVKKIGASVYSARQIDAILEQFPIDLIQLPINILDQRLIRSGHLKQLKKRGVEVYARSVFLQGLLLMDPSDLPDYFYSVRKHLHHYHESIKERNLSPVKSALDFVLNLEEIEATIIGVADSGQFEEIMCECVNAPEMTADDYRNFSWNDEEILDPSRWKVPAR
ncbi:MAG: aldo/keto reductase [Deltaproteobacteria bacterium]|nr:aldo/keto reductase [Deltaproteobacteria bacterium]